MQYFRFCMGHPSVFKYVETQGSFDIIIQKHAYS